MVTELYEAYFCCWLLSEISDLDSLSVAYPSNGATKLSDTRANNSIPLSVIADAIWKSETRNVLRGDEMAS